MKLLGCRASTAPGALAGTGKGGVGAGSLRISSSSGGQPFHGAQAQGFQKALIKEESQNGP